MKFIIECEMNDRWAKPFISMLKTMENDGDIGHSEIVGIYADGDGDFRPKFMIKGADSINEFSPPYPDDYPEECIFDADWDSTDVEEYLSHETDDYFTEEGKREVQRLKDDGWIGRELKR